MWRALTTNFIAPPKLEPLSSVPSVTATGISLLLHAASPVCPEMGEMGTGGAKTIILALLRSRHACCIAADGSSPLAAVLVGLVACTPLEPEGSPGCSRPSVAAPQTYFSKPLHVLGERQARARADERGVGERR